MTVDKFDRDAYIEELRQQDQQRLETITAHLRQVTVAVSEVTTETEFELSEPIDIVHRPERSAAVRVQTLRIKRTSFPATGEPDYIMVEAYGQPLTAKGAVHQSARGGWVYLPDAIGAVLLAAASA